MAFTPNSMIRKERLGAKYLSTGLTCWYNMLNIFRLMLPLAGGIFRCLSLCSCLTILQCSNGRIKLQLLNDSSVFHYMLL
uniref:Uncharacterized protein n=1 Tax=Kalanchoe fedtschenkoi TaxID=63787 RepID=A0A7N0V9L3_KALFE